MDKSLKKFKFDTPKSRLIYLRFILLYLYRHRAFYRNAILELENEINRRNLASVPSRKVPFNVYSSFSDRFLGIERDLFNLIGDTNEMGMSYLVFRSAHDKAYKKDGVGFGANDLSGEDLELVQYFNDLRNWSFHVPMSLANSYLETANAEHPDMTVTSANMEDFASIMVPMFHYRDGEFLTSLLEEKKEIIKRVNSAFLIIKRDYEKLLGKNVRISPLYINEPQSLDDVQPTVASWELQHRRK